MAEVFIFIFTRRMLGPFDRFGVLQEISGCKTLVKRCNHGSMTQYRMLEDIGKETEVSCPQRTYSKPPTLTGLSLSSALCDFIV